MTEEIQKLSIDKRLSMLIDALDYKLSKPAGFLMSMGTWFVIFSLPLVIIFGSIIWCLIAIIPAIFMAMRDSKNEYRKTTARH